MDTINRYKNELQRQIGLTHNNFFFYWKGRVALTAIFKALNLKEGDEVILPAFTCVVVPNAIIYLKAKPVYVDIDLDTYNTSLDRIKAKVTSKTKVVMCQNTFGLSSEVDVISAWCKENNIISIEDCTHGYGGSFNGKPNGSYSDFAFFSTQWNKPFSTGIGGFLLVNNTHFTSRIEEVNKDLIIPSSKDKVVLKALLFAKNKVLNKSNYWSLLKLYRFLSKYNLVIGSSSDEEITSVKEPQNYFKGISSTQINEGIKSVQNINNILTLRKQNAAIYTTFLKKNKLTFVDDRLLSDHSFLKYPLLVKNRDEFLELAEKHKIDLGEWFNSPLHPVQGNLEVWGLNIDNFPNAKHASERMVNLPTDTLDTANVIAFLELYKSMIE
jgi:perosamine synthetase